MAGFGSDGNKKKPLSGLSMLASARNCARHTLRGARLRFRVDADLVPRPALVLELHDAIDQRVDREIAAQTDISAGVPLRSALTDDDVTSDDLLTAELLDAAVLRIAVAPVAR